MLRIRILFGQNELFSTYCVDDSFLKNRKIWLLT
jgi:hypothetical protein